MVALGIMIAVLFGLWYFGERATWAIWTGLDSHRTMRPFAWFMLAPGVATHETAHALAALACGAGVQKFVPFKPKRTEDGWQFGYVQPGPSGTTASGIIALAPLWLTPLLVYGVGSLMTGVSGAEIWSHLSWLNPLTWLWLWWLVSVSLANMPSRPDFVIARPLLLALAILLAIFIAACVTGKVVFDPTDLSFGILAMIAPQAVIVAALASISSRR